MPSESSHAKHSPDLAFRISADEKDPQGPLVRRPVMALRTRMSQRTAARWVLASASLGAGAIHFAVAGEHAEEWPALGVSFLAAGAFQVLWALYLVLRDSRAALVAGGILSVVFIATYLVSRTTGLPLGPEAFEPEPLGAADLLCCALEVPVAVGALLLARRPNALRRPLERRWTVGFAAALVLVATAGGSALASPAHEHEASCPAAPELTGQLDARGVDTGVTAYFSCQLLHEHDQHHTGN